MNCKFIKKVTNNNNNDIKIKVYYGRVEYK
jgi:hypothetical protein